MTKLREVTRRSNVKLTACKHDPKTMKAIAKEVVESVGSSWYDIDYLDFVKVGKKSYAVLGSGCERTAVALCKQHVLKVARSGAYQNEREVEFFKQATPAVKKLITPMYAYSDDYEWLLSRRAEPITSAKFERSRIWKKAREAGLDDVYTNNCGILGKRVVVVDYGLRNGLF